MRRSAKRFGGRVSVKDALQAINSFRNRFAHVPFPYDQWQDVCRELEVCTFRLFEIPPSACNDESPLSGSFAIKDSLLRGRGYRHTPETWQSVERETFVWGKANDQEFWNAQPFILLDRMMRPYLLTRLKNEAGSWEYIRYLAEANAVYSISNPDLLKLLPRPEEADYRVEKEEDAGENPGNALPVVAPAEAPLPNAAPQPITSREHAFAAARERNFEPAIQFWKDEVVTRPYFHSGWQRLGFAQREYGVDLMDSNVEVAEQFLRHSVESFTKATSHSDPQYAAEAFYNRSKSHWRLWRLNQDPEQFKSALNDSESAVSCFYDTRFLSWDEFLKENLPS
jgi:hypothetical protein